MKFRCYTIPSMLFDTLIFMSFLCCLCFVWVLFKFTLTFHSYLHFSTIFGGFFLLNSSFGRYFFMICGCAQHFYPDGKHRMIIFTIMCPNLDFKNNMKYFHRWMGMDRLWRCISCPCSNNRISTFLWFTLFIRNTTFRPRRRY